MELVATLNAPEHRVPLQRQLVTAIQDGLGPEVDVDPFVVRKADSIELLILLSTAAKVISDYNPIVEGIQTAVARTRAIVRDFVAGLPARRRRGGPPQMMFFARWIPGEAVREVQREPQPLEDAMYDRDDHRLDYRLTASLLGGSYLVLLGLLVAFVVTRL